MDDICIRIKELRKDLQLSQVEFASNLGVTNAHISKIEKGGTVPSEALIKLISKEYGVSEWWLKTGKPPIYVYEVEEKTEEQLTRSLDTFNKLLRSDSYLIREVAAELNLCFADITDVSNLLDQQQIAYLTAVKNTLSVVKKYNKFIKDHLYSGQFVMDDIVAEHFKNYRIDIAEVVNDYESLYYKRVNQQEPGEKRDE